MFSQESLLPWALTKTEERKGVWIVEDIKVFWVKLRAIVKAGAIPFHFLVNDAKVDDFIFLYGVVCSSILVILC